MPNIVVLVKQVPDTYSERKLSSADHTLDRASADAVLDEINERAVEEALKIKDNEDQFRERSGDTAGAKKRKMTQSGLFSMPSEGRSPVEPRHVQEAFRRLQTKPKKFRAMLNGTRQQQHSSLRLI